MDAALTQVPSEGGSALAADSDHTQAAAFARHALPEIAMQLDRLVVAIEQQTKAHREIGASIGGSLEAICEAFDDSIAGDVFSASFRRQERRR